MGFVFLRKVGKVKQSKTKQKKEKKKRLQLEKVWKLFVRLKNGTRHDFRATRGGGKARHTLTQAHQLVSSLETFSCKRSLFVCTEWGSKHKRFVIVNTCYDHDDTDNRSHINLTKLQKNQKKKQGSTGLGNSIQGSLTFTIPVKKLQLQATRRCCFCLVN